MPLEVLAVLVGGGVPLAILLAHLTGGSARQPLDRASLQSQLEAQLPGALLEEILLDDAAQTALFTLQDGRHGVAWPMERHIGLRLLQDWPVQQTPEGLEVDLSDPGWPRRRIAVPDLETRQRWLHKRGQCDAA